MNTLANDFTVTDLADLMENFGLHADHEGYLEQLELLDLSAERDARHAIQVWLLPAYQEDWGRTSSGQIRMRSSLRVVLSRWGFLPHGPSLPGIESGRPERLEPKVSYARAFQFYRLLWDELFHEPFERIPETESLQERVDISFVRAPGQPERWGAPQYRSLSYWDNLLDTDAWRENWLPKKD